MKNEKEYCAGVAQLIERFPCKENVRGLIPLTGPNFKIMKNTLFSMTGSYDNYPSPDDVKVGKDFAQHFAKQEAEINIDKNTYMGKEKTRGEFFVKLVRMFNSKGTFGSFTVFKVENRVGATGVFFIASDKIVPQFNNLHIGDCFAMTAFVKEHTDSKFGKETKFNRVKILEIIGKKEKNN